MPEITPAPSVPTEDPSFDAIQAAAAWARLEAPARALAENVLRKLNVDPKRAAIAGLDLAKLVAQAEVVAAFAELSPKHFDAKHLRLLADGAWALWHLSNLLATAEAQTTDVKVSLRLVEESTLRRNRVFKLIEYHLGDDDTVARELNDIRSGAGYFDLAGDATRLGTLWNEHQPVLAQDAKLYVAGDGPRLVKLGELIMMELTGETAATAELRAGLRRVWTLLLESSEEVVAAGQFLFRGTPLAARFKSITTAARVSVRRAAAAEANPPSSGAVVEGV